MNVSKAIGKTVLPPGPKMPGILQLLSWAFRPISLMDNASKACGETFTLSFPGFPREVLFSNPRDIKEIFTGSGDDLHAGKMNAVLGPLLGSKSVLLLDGRSHLEQRKLLLPPFHGERMHSYCEQMRMAADSMIDRWPLDDVFSVHPYTQKFTLEVILKTVFGMSEGPRFDQLERLLTGLLDCVASPILLSKLFQVNLGPLTQWARLQRIKVEINSILFELFEECRDHPDDRRTDVLAMLVAAKHEDGSKMSFDELRDEMITLLVAGHETTATALAWALFHILRTPGVTDKIKNELEEVLGDTEITAAHLPKLKYLDCVVKETLRLTPVVPMVGRVLQAPTTIGGHHLPAGAAAVPCIYLTHRREDIYPDPSAFKPERFIEKTPGPYEFFPFGGGIRRCIGAAFALYEMKIGLAQVFKRTELELAPGYQGKITRRSITFTPEQGMRMRVKTRC